MRFSLCILWFNGYPADFAFCEILFSLHHIFITCYHQSMRWAFVGRDADAPPLLTDDGNIIHNTNIHYILFAYFNYT
jgi:hypothetical protein